MYPYIALEGAIGVGKTTLTRILAEALAAEHLLEVFEENPFLSDFYADRARYAFQTQIFFLLSRYRQQHKVIADTLRRGPLVSDYLFAKDWLFAHLNLSGDELAMYERVHAILGEQIPTPTLVIYLRASTETLMQRIAFRDRSYERQMDRAYISDLRDAYERFFADYTAAPVLSLDTDELDIVHDTAARRAVVAQVKGALRTGAHQLPLPDLDTAADATAEAAAGPLEHRRRLPDFQRLHWARDRENDLRPDLFSDFIGLTGEVGALGRALEKAWGQQEKLLAQVGNRQEAHDRALDLVRDEVQAGLADALARLLKIANDAGVDLETAYLRRLGRSAGDAEGGAPVSGAREAL